MPEIQLKNGSTVSFDRVVVKEHGVAVGMDLRPNKPRQVFPLAEIERVLVDDDVFEDSYMLEEEYDETRASRPDEPGESVTEFKQERRVLSELHIE